MSGRPTGLWPVTKGAMLALCMLVPAAAAEGATMSVTGGEVSSAVSATASCSFAPACPDGARELRQADSHTLKVVGPAGVKAGHNEVRVSFEGGSHQRDYSESHDGSAGGCVGSDAESDGPFKNQPGSELSVTFDFWKGISDPTAVTLGINGNEGSVYTIVSGGGGPTATRTLRRTCNGFTETYMSEANFGQAVTPFSGTFYFENEHVALTSKTPTSVAPRRCIARRCSQTVSGSSTWRVERDIPQFGGRPVATVTTKWSLAVSTDYAPGEVIPPEKKPPPRRPRVVDSYCAVGAPMAEFAVGFTDLVRATGSKAIGPLGLAFGGLGAACTAMNLWDTPVETPGAAIATGACAGLTTFSLGVGAGSLFAAGTVVGLPAALIGGAVSLGTGLVAQIPCAYQASGGPGSARRLRAAQAGEDFREIPTAQAISVRLPRSPRGTPSKVSAQLRALMANTGRVLGAGRALGRCLDRAQAAAAAGDTAWQQRQLSCAADNASIVAKGFRAQSAAHGRIAKAMRATKMKVPATSASRVRRTLAKLPATVRKQLGRTGASRTDIVQLQRVVTRRARKMPVPRTLGAALTGSRSRGTFRAAAGEFDALAKRLRAAAAG